MLTTMEWDLCSSLQSLCSHGCLSSLPSKLGFFSTEHFPANYRSNLLLLAKLKGDSLTDSFIWLHTGDVNIIKLVGRHRYMFMYSSSVSGVNSMWCDPSYSFLGFRFSVVL
jgi:hypothetical protein